MSPRYGYYFTRVYRGCNWPAPTGVVFRPPAPRKRLSGHGAVQTLLPGTAVVPMRLHSRPMQRSHSGISVPGHGPKRSKTSFAMSVRRWPPDALQETDTAPLLGLSAILRSSDLRSQPSGALRGAGTGEGPCRPKETVSTASPYLPQTDSSGGQAESASEAGSVCPRAGLAAPLVALVIVTGQVAFPCGPSS